RILREGKQSNKHPCMTSQKDRPITRSRTPCASMLKTKPYLSELPIVHLLIFYHDLISLRHCVGIDRPCIYPSRLHRCIQIFLLISKVIQIEQRLCTLARRKIRNKPKISTNA